MATEEGDAGIGIGNFSLLTGLSIPRLRRYHELGILVPARVDAHSGYRSYSPDQIPAGRTIAHLRSVDLPLEELRELLDADEGLGILRRHRHRLVERVSATKAMVDLIDHLIREETTVTTTGVQLVELVLQPEDHEDLIAFYRSVFGMDFEPDDHNGTVAVRYHACGGSWDPEGVFIFTIFPAEGAPTRCSIGFGVPDLDPIWKAALAAGAKEVRAPYDDPYIPRNAIFDDPAGNRVSLYERRDW